MHVTQICIEDSQIGKKHEAQVILRVKVHGTNFEHFDYVDHNKLWKLIQDMGIPDHLTCLLRNLYAGQETTVRTGRAC